MSNSYDSSTARESWIDCLTNLQRELSQVYPGAKTIHNEEEFRDEFQGLDAELHDDDPAINYAFFMRKHDQPQLFARSIDESIELTQTPSLKELFWTIALAAVELGFNHEFDFAEISDLYEPLNSDFPGLSLVELSQFPRSQLVQECLQTIFEAYYYCYLEFLRQVQTDAEEITTKPIKEQLLRAAVTYRTQRAEFESRCENARREAEARRHRSTTVTSNADAAEPRFVHLKPLGSGSYGQVDAVRETTSGVVYARKTIPFTAGGQDASTIERRVKSEADIMSKLRHNHIASVNLHYKTDTWNIIMSPVADMDLHTFLEEKCIGQNYPSNMIRKIDPWFGCLISALTFAHDEQIKHEDIKPRNILILKNKVYLTDFGTAKDFSELEASTVSDFLEQGTPVYWAPELRPWGRAADVFALGCVFAEMLTVRQSRSLRDFREFRHNSTTQGFRYGYAASLPKVKRWLKDMLGITSKDNTAQTILEQTLNMLIDDPQQRLESRRIKRNLRVDERLFCNSCI